MATYLFNTLSSIISSQILLTDTLSSNYYNSQEIDQKLSGITEFNSEKNLDQSLNIYYQKAVELQDSFDF